jgi:hypothetical protein
VSTVDEVLNLALVEVPKGEQLLAEAEQAKTEAKGEKEPVRPH